MAYQVLEVTLISAKDLKRVTLFTKMRVYAVASITGGDPRVPTHRTYADREGGQNPMWHAPLRFTIPPAADHPRGLALHVLLRAERAFGDRDVGEVVVPVQDLAAAASPEAGAEQRYLSYLVRRPVSGRKRGVLHISYRLSDAPAPDAHQHPYAQAPPASSMRHHGKAADAAITAYPVATPRGGGAQQYHHQPYGPAPYGGPGAYRPHHQYGYGYGAAPAARSGGGMGTAGLGLGLGLLGGLVIGDMIGDAEVDAA